MMTYTLDLNGASGKSVMTELTPVVSAVESFYIQGKFDLNDKGTINCNDIPLLKFTVTADGVVWEGLN